MRMLTKPAICHGLVSWVLVAGLAAAGLVFETGTAAADAGFRKWIQGFRSVAAKSGISHKTYDSVFAGVSEPDEEVLEAARYQPEFTSKVWDYLDSRISESIIRRGREMAAQYKPWLDRIEPRFGVDRHILLAIWSMESSYGEALERKTGIRSVARSLATLAYADPKRAKFARSQLIAAMKIVQAGDVSAAGLTGSWAGAMGHTQFIPTSYLAWAVDIDGDGHRNVWTSPPDALASAANLLRKNGWQTGETWGYEVKLPPGFNTRLEGKDGITLAKWTQLGVRRARGNAFPRPGDQAVLKLPGGADGPAFLMVRNFYVLKRYNNADKYALGVGLLADELAGHGGLVQDWPRGYEPLDEDGRMRMQRHLQQLGFYDGEIDGKFGPASRKAVVDYQKRNGVTPDGFPSKKLLDRLEQG
ncbi:MAG: lytic murein transglycosylase [Pseudomonadota bacterium]|nr:lytic murein transglycosylase [Pseudomonadota bacterium]